MVWKSNQIVLGVIAAAVFMANLDLWIVNVALVSVAHGLSSSLASLSWVLNAYAVTLAALLIPAGRLGDRIGQRKVFLWGIALFTVGSLGCALAPDVTMLVVARVAQAAGASAQLPTSLALLLAAVTPERRLGAARGWAATGALAAVAGPVLGGLLVSVSWRWVFVVNLPIGLASLGAGRAVLPRSEPNRREAIPDLLGSAVLIAAMALVTGALVEAPSWGWGAPRTLAMLVGGLGFGAAFLRRCRVHPVPIVELQLLRVRRFAAANAATFVLGASFAVMLLSTSLWCQDVWHYSPLRTGLAMMPGPGVVPIVTLASNRLLGRMGPGRLAALGCFLFGASLAWRALCLGVRPDYLTDLLPSMVLSGIGVGLALGTLIAAGATALPEHRAATGSAIINSSRQLASALGVALLVTVLGNAPTDARGYATAWTLAAVLAGLSAASSLLLPRPRPGAISEGARKPETAALAAAELGD